MDKRFGFGGLSKANLDKMSEFEAKYGQMMDELEEIDTMLLSEEMTSTVSEKLEHKEKPLFSNAIVQDKSGTNVISTSCNIKVIECDENVKYISEKWDETPCGIIECQIPHIGATYLEMQSNRNSIIVFPDESEAYKHFQKYPNSIYVKENKTTEEDLFTYIQNNTRHKFIVTPQSAGWLLSQLNKDGNEDNVLKYFFMVKDMEQLQLECTYKTGIDKILDFYLAFPKDKRCIYTTDYKAFTHPALKNEDVHIVKWRNLPKRNIEVIPCNNIIGVLKETIEKIPTNEKVLIVYTSIQQARLVILNLAENMQEDCCIWGKEYNKDETGEDFFVAINNKSKSLPKRLTFLSIKDFDLQVEDKCHLITVSDASNGKTLLSIKDFVRIYGLCKSDLLSDRIIHNKAVCYGQWNNEIDTLVERVKKIVELQNTADELSEGDESLKRLFSIVSTTLRNKATGRIRGKLPNIKLTRKDFWNKCAVAYMHIDNLLLRVNLCQTYYSNFTLLGKKLNELYNITPFSPNKDIASTLQQEIECKEKELRNKKRLEERTVILDEILKLHMEGQLSQEYLDKKSKTGKRLSRKTHQEVAKLYPYIDTVELIEKLKDINSGNRIGFNNLNNSIIYWALEDNHPLKLSMNEAFKVGGKYTNTEIRDKMNAIILYHFHRDWSGNTRKPITLFKCFFNTIRPRLEYIIQSELCFKCHKDRINKSEDDLLKLFIISDVQTNKGKKRKSDNKPEKPNDVKNTLLSL